MLIRLLKILTVILITASTIILFAFDPKTNGKLNQWGIAVLVSTILAGLSTVITEILEHTKAKRQELIEQAKEEERKKLLSNIQDDIARANHPLVPFRLFYTVRHTTRADVIERYFKDQKGYKSMKKSEFLDLVGTVKLGSVPYNFEEERPKQSHCTLEGTVIDSIVVKSDSEETVVKLPTFFSIEIFTKPDSKTPMVTFEYEPVGAIRKGTVKEIRLYDNWLYQDTRIANWNIKTTKDTVFGLKDLRNARIRITADFFSQDKINDEHPPRFTNLHFYFGNDPTNLLYFDKSDLDANQTSFRRNPMEGLLHLENELAQELFTTLSLRFEITVTDNMYQNQIVQFAY